MTRKQQYLTSAIVFASFPPLMILAHELGHYSVARLLGYHAQFRYAEIFIPANQGVSNSHSLWITLAGPLVGAVMTVVGLSWLIRNYRAERAGHGLSVWVFSALGLAAFRWLKVIFNGKHSDEGSLSEMAGWHYLTLPMLLLPVALFTGSALFNFHRKQQTLLPLGVGFCAGLASVALWFSAVGPALFPYPEAPNRQVNVWTEAVGPNESGQLDSGAGPVEPTGRPLMRPLNVELIGKRVRVRWDGNATLDGKSKKETWWLADVTDVFPEDGTLGIHYVGWSKKWDEIVPASRVLMNPSEEK